MQEMNVSEELELTEKLSELAFEVERVCSLVSCLALIFLLSSLFFTMHCEQTHQQNKTKKELSSRASKSLPNDTLNSSDDMSSSSSSSSSNRGHGSIMYATHSQPSHLTLADSWDSQQGKVIKQGTMLTAFSLASPMTERWVTLQVGRLLFYSKSEVR